MTRPVVALVTTLLLWGGAYPVVLRVLWRSLAARPGLGDPGARQVLLTRWCRYLRIAGAAGVWLTVALLPHPRLALIRVSPSNVAMFYAFAMYCWYECALRVPTDDSSLIGRFDAGSGGLLGALLLVTLTLFELLPWSRHRLMLGGLVALAAVVFLLPVVGGVLLLARVTFRHWSWRRDAVEHAALPEDPEALRELLRQFELEETRRRAAGTEGALPSNVSAIAQTFLAGLQNLAPDQVAALNLSARTHAGRVAPQLGWSLFFILAMLTAAAGTFVAIAYSPRQARMVVCLGLVGVIGLLWVTSTLMTMLITRRQEREQLATDLRVARAMEEPQRFLAALALMETLEATAFSQLAVRAPSVAARRRRMLEREL